MSKRARDRGIKGIADTRGPAALARMEATLSAIWEQRRASRGTA